MQPEAGFVDFGAFCLLGLFIPLSSRQLMSLLPHRHLLGTLLCLIKYISTNNYMGVCVSDTYIS